MELIHILQGTTIEEPIGFDSFAVKIKRGEYHGMSAEISIGDLEFYGIAYGLIFQAYNSDIDTELSYIVTDQIGNVIYTGAVDLSTCSFFEGDYHSVSCKVGEVGLKTTFNNRSETEIDLNIQTTIGGLSMDQRPKWWSMAVPTKQLCHTNRSSQKIAKYYHPTGFSYYNIVSSPTRIPFLLDTSDKNEFGNINTDTPTSPMYQVDDVTEFNKEFGAGCKMTVDGKVLVDVYYQLQISSDWSLVDVDGYPSDHSTYFCCISRSESYTIKAKYSGGNMWKDESDNVYTDVIAWKDGYSGLMVAIRIGVSVGSLLIGYADVIPSSLAGNVHVEIDLSGSNINASTSQQISLFFYGDFNIYDSQRMYFYILEKSKIRMKMYDTIQIGATNVPMISVFDALNSVCQHITDNGIKVESGFYQLSSDFANIGEGALKYLTNGYKMRNLYTDSDKKRSMPASIKSLISSLNAIDCVGFALIEENGSIVMRVERWPYFYKSNVMLTCTNVDSVKYQLSTDKIITELTIGYAKYETSSDYDSIDSIHGERTFVSKIKAVKNAVSKKCDWIADNYAIEEARRAGSNLDKSAEGKFDANIFVFEACKLGTSNPTIAKSATNVQGLDRPTELINALLSPRHMAARWKDFIFSCNSQSGMAFSTGKINYDASFGVKQSDANNYYNISFADGSLQKENDAIINRRAIFEAESIVFDYPITIEQYHSILSNPYGLISVNGVRGWLDEFSYKFSDGLASFKLIKKH